MIENDPDEVLLQNVVVGINYGSVIHPLVELPSGREYGSDVPLPYGSLMQMSIGGWCKCRDFEEIRFIYNDICCATVGGQFWDYIVEERNVAEGTNLNHSDRDPNINYRYKMYAKFCEDVGISGVRKELPSCYVNAVREIWPSPNGNYVGFKLR